MTDQSASVAKPRFSCHRYRAFLPLATALLLYACAALLLSGTPLFWDSVSILSRPATFLYENRFTDFSFPEGTVSDNLPLSALLAGWWMVFGRTLFSTHVLFMLFGFGVIWQIFLLCRRLELPEKALPYVFLLVLSDATLVTQLIVPMFDSVLLFFTLLTIRYMLEDRKAGAIFGTMALSLLRSRGFIMCGALGIAYLILQYRGRTGTDRSFRQDKNRETKPLLKTLAIFFPAMLAGAGMFGLQWSLQSEVFGLGADSPWKFASPGRILGNALALPRFLLEFGRIFLWGMLLYLLFRYRFRCFRQAVPVSTAVIYMVVLVVLAGMTVPFRNPYGGRYFLVLFVLMPLLAGKIMFALLPIPHARLWCVLLALTLWGGHFWRYPDSVAVSWDGSLAHLPYYPLREEMLRYLDDKGITPSEVRSFFPADKPAWLIDLDGTKEPFAQPGEPARYALFSNMSNLPNPAVAGIDTAWVLVKRFERGQVYVSLYEDRQKNR